jgi:transposase
MTHPAEGRLLTILDRYKSYLHRRWNEGITDAAQLYREITAFGWPNRVEHDGEPELRTFAKGLRRDLAAVTAGLTLPYSSEPVEGNVNL